MSRICTLINEDPSLSFVFNHTSTRKHKIKNKKYQKTQFDSFMLNAYDMLIKVTKNDPFMNVIVNFI